MDPKGIYFQTEEVQILHTTKTVIIKVVDLFLSEKNHPHYRKYITSKYFSSQQVFYT